MGIYRKSLLRWSNLLKQDPETVGSLNGENDAFWKTKEKGKEEKEEQGYCGSKPWWGHLLGNTIILWSVGFLLITCLQRRFFWFYFGGSGCHFSFSFLCLLMSKCSWPAAVSYQSKNLMVFFPQCFMGAKLKLLFQLLKVIFEMEQVLTCNPEMLMIHSSTSHSTILCISPSTTQWHLLRLEIESQ